MVSCIECGEKFAGRSDKKFCNDSCRSAFHNKVGKKDKVAVSRINRVLMKNRKILGSIVAGSTLECSFEELVKSGFNFGYFTSIERDRKRGLVYYCYEYAYSFCKERSSFHIWEK